MPTVLRANLGFQSEVDFAPTGFFSGWRVNLDYIYSQYRDPYTIVDLSQTVDPSRGLDGFTIDGRPIYRAIDPTRGRLRRRAGVDRSRRRCGPTSPRPASRPSRDDELMLTNSGGYRSHIASAILSKNFDARPAHPGRIGASPRLGYSYTNSQDRRNLYNSTAGSNYDQTAAFDRQNPAAVAGLLRKPPQPHLVDDLPRAILRRA